MSSAETPFQKAVRLGKLKQVERGIAKGEDVNQIGYICRVLSVAALHGRVEVVQALLDAGADVNAADLEPNATRHFFGRPEPKYGADYVASTALTSAASNGRTECVRLLIAAGARIDQRTGRMQQTALSNAAENGHAETVSALLEAGAAVDVKDSSGWTALYWAVFKKHPQVVRLLLDAGADPNCGTKMTALQAACRDGHPEIAKMLIAAGADMNAVTHQGTALIQAVKSGSRDLVEILLAAGADPDLRIPEGDGFDEDYAGQSARTLAQRLGNEDVIRALADRT